MVDNLQSVRDDISNIDAQIIKALGKRVALVKKIGILKTALDLPIENPQLESKNIELYRQRASEQGVSEDLVQNLFEELFWDARRIQKELREG